MRELKAGEIKFCHVRNYGEDGEILPFGGLTIAFTKLDEGKIVASLAVCSDRDNFNKKVGRLISMGRLLSQKPGMNYSIDTPVQDIFALKSLLSKWALKLAYGS